ncbi:MAG: excalibur calcium-binding domain-containing protein [Solibacillus sp.]
MHSTNRSTRKPVVEVNPTPKPVEKNGDINSRTYLIPGAPTTFKNCVAMRKYYPNSVTKAHPAYTDARNGDKDGWAFEN